MFKLIDNSSLITSITNNYFVKCLNIKGVQILLPRPGSATWKHVYLIYMVFKKMGLIFCLIAQATWKPKTYEILH